MSWDRTYSHNVLYGLDCLGAILFWNQPDITISSLCRLVQLVDAAYSECDSHDGGTVEGCAGCFYDTPLHEMNLWKWQIWILRKLAPLLDKIQAGHCELARKADIARAFRTLELLKI